MATALTRRYATSRGFTMLEVAMLMLLLSIVFVPVVSLMFGQTNRTEPTVTQMNEQNIMKQSAANSLMERALSGVMIAQDLTTVNNVLNPSTIVNAANLVNGGTATIGPYNYTVAGSKPLKYQWELQDYTYDAQGNRVTPKGNRLVKATLNMFSQEGTKVVNEQTFSTYVYLSEGVVSSSSSWVGVSLVADTSGSMCSSKAHGEINEDNLEMIHNGVCGPFLNDRFHRTTIPPDPTTLPASKLKLFDDRNLDIAFSRPVDDPSTPYLDTYPQAGTLGLHPVTSASANECSELYMDQDVAIGGWPKDKNFNWLVYTGNQNPWWSHLSNIWAGQNASAYHNLCRPKSWMTDKQWENDISKYITRFEALRGALLGFLVKVERDQDLVNSLSMGLTTFSTDATTKVPMATPVTTILDPETSLYRPRFEDLRHKLAFVNRWDKDGGGANSTRTIKADGWTNYEEALKKGALAFDADPRINTKIMIFVSDGAPTIGNTDAAYLESLGQAIAKNCRTGNTFVLGNPAACSTNPKDWVTIYVVGMDGIPAENLNLLQKLAENSGGRFINATEPKELQNALFSLSYDIKKSLLVSRVDRFDEGLAGLL
jgi:type II secretory pathway pseudopilin PulG